MQSVDRWDGEPLRLEEWQQELFGEALAYDEAGLPIFTSIVILLPRKNGKTMLLSAYALWRLLTSDGSPEILLAASSDKQAQRLYENCAKFVYRNEFLSDVLRVRDHAGEIRREDGMGVIYRLSSDPARLHGFNPSEVVIDELHAWLTPSLRRAHTALTTGGGARSAPRVFTISTAGEAATRKSSILGRILDGALAGEVEQRPGLTICRDAAAQMLVYNHEAPTRDPFDVDSMMLANPASWISPEFLLRQANNPELTDADVLQLHGCVWAESERSFVAPEQISDAQVGWEPLADGERVVIGFDGSERRDETWLCACSLDGRIETLQRWARPRGAPEDWSIPRNEVHEVVRQAFARFEVMEFAFDPPGWWSEGDAWAAEYGEVVVQFETNRPIRFAPAVERVRTAFQEGAIHFGGSLGHELAKHFGQAQTRETPAGVVLQKDHPDSPRKIDGAVAAIIAYDRAAWHAANPSGGLAMLVSFS